MATGTTHYIEILKAWEKGRPIEFRRRTSPQSDWKICFEPMFNFNDYDYRIKKVEITLNAKVYRQAGNGNYWVCVNSNPYDVVDEPCEFVKEIEFTVME